MPPLEEVDCWDVAVLWPATGGYDNQGQPLFGDPIELAYPNGVRWINAQRQQLAADGNLILVDATAIVLQDIPIHSKMWLGELADWYGTGSANTTDTNLMTVKTFNKTYDQRGQDIRRTVGLLRLHN